MKTTTVSSLLFALITTACGSVAAPTDPVDPDQEEPAPTDPTDPTDPGDEELPPPPPPALQFDAPAAATGSDSLFGQTFDTVSSIHEVVSGPRRFDVVAQRFSTVTSDPVQLDIELDLPTGTYERTIGSDTIRIATRTDHVLCASGNIETFDPRCETAAPLPREIPSIGAIAPATWTLRVIDETGQLVTGCTSPGARRIQCVLPGKAGARYQVVASAASIADVWDGRAGLGAQSLKLTMFTGAIAAQPEWQCWDWANSGTNFYCTVRYEFTRFYGIDKASVAFDPMTIRVTANGQTSAMASPALTWDAGDDDLPGSAY